MSSTAAKVAETAATTTQPVVFSVAGMTFLGIPFQDWVLIGTSVLLCFNIAFASVRMFTMLKGDDDE